MEVHDADLVVVGAGPAGSAAAITALRLGLRVVLVEAARFPRFRPGETLSKDAVSLIEHLLGADAFERLPKLPHEGVRRQDGDAGDASRFAPGDPGIHIDRAQLDAALLDAAIRAGARVRQPSVAQGLDASTPGVVVVATDRGGIRCRFVVDASGPTQWLSRHLALPTLAFSRPLRVFYQYWRREAPAPFPTFSLGKVGWRWRTDLPGRKAVTASMAFDGDAVDLQGLTQPLGAVRHADCTWRITGQLADACFAVTGDAACHTDPAGSRGVWRALASGMGAAEAAHARITGRPGGDPLEAYCRSVTQGFLEDCRALNAAYRHATGRDDPIDFARRSQSLFWGSEQHVT